MDSAIQKHVSILPQTPLYHLSHEGILFHLQALSLCYESSSLQFFETTNLGRSWISLSHIRSQWKPYLSHLHTIPSLLPLVITLDEHSHTSLYVHFAPIYSILNIAARVILFQSQIMSFNSPRLFNGSHLICYFSKLSSICSPGRPFSSTPTCSIHTSHPPASLSWRELLSPSSKHFSSDFYLSNSLVFFQYVFKCYLYNFSHPDHSV